MAPMPDVTQSGDMIRYMEEYKTRKIRFQEVYRIDNWAIKIYTISKVGEFEHPQYYQSVKAELPKWLSMKNSFDASHENIGFLILHAGTEGIFSLVNWWVGKNMLNTHIFMTDSQQPDAFKRISGDGLAPCIWELEVINHERLSWMRNVLKQASAPNYQGYLQEVYNGEM
ncbi:hypothetical protein AAG747_14240 [Rapidithrix thailandica]|uniref:Uncharacterized protein n=1 Tax=Rapidithrix thailandica TaxID=413964 RepID=A0AAW9SCL1_9BACT